MMMIRQLQGDTYAFNHQESKKFSKQKEKKTRSPRLLFCINFPVYFKMHLYLMLISRCIDFLLMQLKVEKAKIKLK